DEPDEEIERRGPRPPREPVVARRLDGEQRCLRDPAEANAPGGGAAGAAGPPHVAEIAHGRLAVEQERGPEEQLSQRAPAPAVLLPHRRPAPGRRARPPRARAAGA